MKDHLSKLTKVAFALLLTVYNLLQFMPVKAIDTNTTVIDLVIDDNDGLDLDYSIDGIDRFNQYGIAIIMDETVVNSTTVRKYGLINDEGEVLLAPIYDEVAPFDTDNNFFIVSEYQTVNQNTQYIQGLYSQRSGAEVLPIQYSWIPSLEGRTLIDLGYQYFNESIGNFEWRNQILGYDANSGSFSDIESPSDVNISEYPYLWIDRVSNFFNIVYASRSTNKGWENKSWIVDRFGHLFTEMTRSYNYIQYMKTSTNNFLIVQYSEVVNDSNEYRGGLYKIGDTNGSIWINEVLSPEDYEGVWYNDNEGYVQVNYTTTSGNWVNGEYDLETELWRVGKDPNQNQSNEFSYWQDPSLTMVQNCSINQSNQYTCNSYLYKAADSQKTNIFGLNPDQTNKTYQDVYSTNSSTIVGRNGSTEATSYSNVILKNGSNYFKLLTEDIWGYIWVNSNGWITINRIIGISLQGEITRQQYIIDPSFISSTQTLVQLESSEALLTKNGYSWQMFGRYQYISDRISDSVSRMSLYDNVTKQYILQNVYNLNIQEPQNGTLIGSYYTQINNQNIYKAFTYNVTGSSVNFKTYDNIVYLSRYNSSGYAIVNTLDNKPGLIDSTGSGTFIIDPSENKNNTSMDLHFDYDGTKDVVITTESDDQYTYYYLGSESLTLPNLTYATKYEGYPATILDSTGYAFVDGATINRTNLSDALKVSAYTNGIALKQSIVNSVNVVTAYKANGTSLGNVSSNGSIANDFSGNFVLFDSTTLRFAYLDGETIAFASLPNSISNHYSTYTVSNFRQIYNNFYEYTYEEGGTNRGLLYFNPSTHSIIDIGRYSGSFYNSSEGFFGYEYYSGSTLKKGYIKSDGTLNLMDIGSEGLSYYYDNSYIYIMKNNGTSTILDASGNYLLTHMTNGNIVPEFYTNIWVDKKIIRYGENNSNNTAIITPTGVVKYENVQSRLVEGTTNLILLSQYIDQHTGKYGLITTDGTVIFDINASTPYQYINVMPEYNLILPYLRGELMDNGYYNNTNIGFFDLNGNPITELAGYQLERDISVDGVAEVSKSTNYRRVSNDNTTEDVKLRNSYNFATKEFEYPKDYYNSYTSGNYKVVYSLGDLENAPAWSSNTGGDKFFKKVDGVWDNTPYVFSFSMGYSDLNDQTIIPSGLYDYINVVGDYFVVNKKDTRDGEVWWSYGLLNSFGEPVACANYTYTNGVRNLDNNGNPIIELTCDNIQFNKKQNKFILSEMKRVDNPYEDSPDPYYYIGLTNMFNITTKTIEKTGLSWLDTNKLDRDGVAVVRVYENFLDNNPNNDSINDLTAMSQTKAGVLLSDGTFMIQPEYMDIQDFNGNGYSIIRKLIGVEEGVIDYEGDEDGFYHVEILNTGLIHNTRGIILEDKYSWIDSTFTRRDSWSTPIFDSRGLLKIIINDYTNLPAIKEYVGLADENGELFDGASYERAYFVNGEFYLKKFDNAEWLIINDNDITDAQMHGEAWDQYLVDNANTLDYVRMPALSDVSYNRIERKGNFFVVQTERYSDIFNRTYEYYGVVRSDGSIYLDFDYTSIIFNEIEDNWNLEIYNTLFGTYQKAVMAMDKTFVVPFNNKYDSLGDFVEGFAIGTSGEAEEIQETSYNPFVKLLTSFFLPIQASASQPITTSDEEFVLEIIDENGNVVGDLSNDYDSAILLGEVDGVVKAMVEKDGQYFIATLTEVPFTGERITSIEVDKPTLTLRVGESSKLFAEVFPLTSTQPKTITWSSSNNAIVSVDGKGNIKALSEGTAVITLKVNNFTTTSTITVSNATTVYADSKTVVGTVDKIIKTVTTSPKQKDVLSDVTKMVNALNEPNSLSIAEFKTVLTSLLKQAPNFVESLTQEEVYALDDYLFEAYPIGLDVLASDVPFMIQGMASLLNLQDLVDGKSVSLVFELKTSLSDEDNATITKYIETQLLDDSIMYSLDIQIKLEVDGTTSDISTLKQKVKLSFELPEKFVGEGELEILRIHEGVVDRLPVMLGNDYTFSFETDRFSSFTLIKKVEMQRIDEPKQDVFVKPNDFNWPLGLASGMLVVGVGTYIILKRKKKWLS